MSISGGCGPKGLHSWALTLEHWDAQSVSRSKYSKLLMAYQILSSVKLEDNNVLF